MSVRVSGCASSLRGRGIFLRNLRGSWERARPYSMRGLEEEQMRSLRFDCLRGSRHALSIRPQEPQRGVYTCKRPGIDVAPELLLRHLNVVPHEVRPPVVLVEPIMSRK